MIAAEDAKRTAALAVKEKGDAVALRRWLRAHPSLEVVQGGASVSELADAMRRRPADLVFLDAGLDGGDALDLLRFAGAALAGAALVVLSSAREDAFRAFEIGAVDFLELPSRAERVARAVDRALGRLSVDARDGSESRDISVAGAGEPGLQRLVARSRGRWVVIPTASLLRVESDRNYLVLHREGGEPVRIRYAIDELERQLDPAAFFRIHRSTIVRLDQVTEILATDKGDYRIRLRDGSEARVPRSRRDAFLAALEGPPPSLSRSA